MLLVCSVSTVYCYIIWCTVYLDLESIPSCSGHVRCTQALTGHMGKHVPCRACHERWIAQAIAGGYSGSRVYACVMCFILYTGMVLHWKEVVATYVPFCWQQLGTRVQVVTEACSPSVSLLWFCYIGLSMGSSIYGSPSGTQVHMYTLLANSVICI